MKENSVMLVRVYLTEGDRMLNAIIGYLHDEIKVKGVTIFRAISGYGKSGAMHSSDLLTMSLNLPLVVGFYDEKSVVEKTLQHLQVLVGDGHIIHFPVSCL